MGQKHRHHNIVIPGVCRWQDLVTEYREWPGDFVWRKPLCLCRKLCGRSVRARDDQSAAATGGRLPHQPWPHGQVQQWNRSALQRTGAWRQHAALPHETGAWSQAAEAHSRRVQVAGECKHPTSSCRKLWGGECSERCTVLFSWAKRWSKGAVILDDALCGAGM